MKRPFHHAVLLIAAILVIAASPSRAEPSVAIKFDRQEIEHNWRARIKSILDQGKIPSIDLLSFLPRQNGDDVLRRTMKVMDDLGVALISFAGYPAPKDGSRGYRWGYFIHRIVNQHPDRFILTTNKGSNRNWWQQKGGRKRHFIDQLEQQVRSGDYPFVGQIEFRHHMSNAQCKAGKTHRDIDIPLNGSNGHRVFRLSAETGIPFSIHLEPENRPLDALEEMLAAYPQAKVIVSHFGQLRHPERQKRFGPKLVARLLAAYPNLYFDLSTGEPGRTYRCTGVLDTVIWKDGLFGGQTDTLKPEYRKVLTMFSDRFVVGFDYGPLNRQSATYLRKRIRNIRLIMRDLPDEAKHKIGYRNAWRLLTGKSWK